MTAGQKAFTGSGTAWKLRGCEGALVIVAGAGAVNFVSTLSTDAAGEFRTAWTGPTLANAQYTMWLPSAVAATALANHQRLAEIIASIQTAQPSNKNLSALSALVGAAGKIPRFIGEETMDLVDYIADPQGSLAKLAASTSIANRSLQTDNSNNIVFAPLGLELIASDTNNNEVAAWVKTGLGTTYREVFMFVDGAPVNAGGSLNVQLSSDNGATWLTATSEYSEQALVASGTNVTAVAPSSPGIGSGATAASVGGGGAIMDIKLGEFNQFRRTMYSAFVSRRANSGAMELVTRNGLVTPWVPFNAMRLVCSNGNLARFRVVLMGVRG